MAYRRKHYFHECPFCGAALDPGETCDCCDLRKAAGEQNADREQEAEPEQKEQGTRTGTRMRPAYSGNLRRAAV